MELVARPGAKQLHRRLESKRSEAFIDFFTLSQDKSPCVANTSSISSYARAAIVRADEADSEKLAVRFQHIGNSA
uniref:Tudor domain-containing protein n=1 Tax=Globisporangium ultimum (strain ATCC 200006 / CBS 805.95 / DAOM BR144) TaxID=431595 RepID=K3W8U1_GLOUD